MKYYRIVDPKTKSADVFMLQKEKYHETGVFKDGKMLFHLGPCKIQLDFSKLFGNIYRLIEILHNFYYKGSKRNLQK